MQPAVSFVGRHQKSGAASRMTAAITQQAAVLVRPKQTRVDSFAVTEPGEHQVRVKLEGCGICASHLPVWEGRPWFNYPQEAGAPGHEGWGVVDALGCGVDDLEVGQRVALISGHAYAQYDIASRDCVIQLPEELDDEPFPGEAFARAMNVFELSDIHAGHKVAIVGANFVGLLLTQLASDRGAHVVVVSHRPFALEFADTMDAEETLLAQDDGYDAKRALGMNGGCGFDRVIEVAGTQTALDLAGQICADHGVLTIAGDHLSVARRNLQGLHRHRPGLRVVNAAERSRECCIKGVERAILAALEGRLDPFPLMSHTVSMSSLDLGFRLTHERPEGFVKALVMLHG